MNSTGSKLVLDKRLFSKDDQTGSIAVQTKNRMNTGHNIVFGIIAGKIVRQSMRRRFYRWMNKHICRLINYNKVRILINNF
ncbi:hypothetical protein SDC9_195474 [bioreactor metagenome]|uniref:Uncharacterized protein n=1 Tax=bioreactor metagenome TaxID=1076179 RepID=A0A645I9T9_9ZZZZ